MDVARCVGGAGGRSGTEAFDQRECLDVLGPSLLHAPDGLLSELALRTQMWAIGIEEMTGDEGSLSRGMQHIFGRLPSAVAEAMRANLNATCVRPLTPSRCAACGVPC